MAALAMFMAGDDDSNEQDLLQLGADLLQPTEEDDEAVNGAGFPRRPAAIQGVREVVQLETALGGLNSNSLTPAPSRKRGRVIQRVFYTPPALCARHALARTRREVTTAAGT